MKFFWNLDGNSIFLFSIFSVSCCFLSDSESELTISSLKNSKKRKVDVKNSTAKMNASSKIASDKLIKDEGKETLENRSMDQRAAHKMRKNEIKEHLENRSKEQRVSTLSSLYLALWFLSSTHKHVVSC